MSETGSALRRLHQILTAMHRIRSEIDRGPRLVRVKKKLATEKAAQIDELKGKLTDARKFADQKQLQLRSNEDKILALKGKLNEASSNREFDAVKSQMEADQMANSVLEDEILETLERVDLLGESISRVEGEKQEAEEEVKKFEAEVKAKQGDLESELAQLALELTEAEKIIPDKLRVDYRRLIETHGATSLAPVENKACTTCSTMVSPQIAIDLNVGKFVFCRSCGRLLYNPES
ncbi:zinc ribbon domain-containing protein [Stratiformator vulcanicus]|uniref:Zinc ribbon domain protein n=1 Tax=Stratiformator vulcanicus TaxID=2527980 RepID=A0A517R0F1_9PLAN|nr:phospholipase [Stratiformator vulcanicus]QDT37375.1 Putative zinc ribbon domain protein [Stratiformator vulcanicus]